MKRIKSANYLHAVNWIAKNDGAGDDDALVVDYVSEMVTVALVADIFGVTEAYVATDVVRARVRSANEPTDEKLIYDTQELEDRFAKEEGRTPVLITTMAEVNAWCELHKDRAAASRKS